MASRLLSRVDVRAKRCWSVLGRSIGLIAAMWLWADAAKTVVTAALPKASAGHGGTGVDQQHAAFPSDDATNAAPTSRSKSDDECWAPDPVYGIRKTPRIETDYTIDASAPGWEPTNVCAADVRIVASRKGGATLGLEFRWVMPHSVYDKLGMKQGDVLRSVNGYELHTPDRNLEVYQKLRRCRWFEIELERNGRILRKAYSVK